MSRPVSPEEAPVPAVASSPSPDPDTEPAAGSLQAEPADSSDPRWQSRHSVTDADSLAAFLHGRASAAFLADLDRGLRLAPMQLRLTPHLLSRIDWDDPWVDPIRRQFLPLASEAEPDHPMCRLDSLAEQSDEATPGLVHRYPDRALFLALDVCPVYCRFCTRSYSVGSDTDEVKKTDIRPVADRWEQAFAYLREHPEVEDVVVSGGDAYMLPASRLRRIGLELLAIPHIRRIRFATKGLSVLPQKILRDRAWTRALLEVHQTGLANGQHVCVHTHFNHPSEVTEEAERALDLLFRKGVTTRNQSVLIRGVNDDAAVMERLIRRLAACNVQPYYVYVHDMVPGVESLRTSLGCAIEIEKEVRGRIAGFAMPTFVCDAPGGGGKRSVHSFEHYDPERGVAVFRSPVIDRDRGFVFVDPLRDLSPAVQAGWQDPLTRDGFLADAHEQASTEGGVLRC